MKKLMALLTAPTLTAVAWGSGTVTWENLSLSEEWDGATAYLLVGYGEEIPDYDTALTAYMTEYLSDYDSTTETYTFTGSISDFVSILTSSSWLLSSTTVSSSATTYESEILESAMFTMEGYNEFTSGYSGDNAFIVDDDSILYIDLSAIEKSITSETNTDGSEHLTVDFSVIEGTYTFNFITSSDLSPEPTSGILLLLGAAGLSLRRRRH